MLGPLTGKLGTVTEKAGFSDKKAASAQRIEHMTLIFENFIFERTYFIIRDEFSTKLNKLTTPLWRGVN